jgi:hypothetical protein
MAAMTIWIVDCRHRPAILDRISRSTSSRDSPAKSSISAGARPMVRPSRIPLTDSDSSTIADIPASLRCRAAVIRRRSSPTRRLIHTKHGNITSDTAASRQSSANMAMIAATTEVKLETMEVAVVVTVDCMPPISLAMRDCTSPVRVVVKNASGILCNRA